MITKASTLEDVCYAVCTALDRSGTTAVLTGGSAATIYAPEAYQSGDADYVVVMFGASSNAVMQQLGYTESGGMYRHATSPFTIEFPRGPLAVGDDIITAWETLRRDDQLLHILTRTDSVRDRLSWLYYHTDWSALSAAIGVAQSGEINVGLIRDWSIREDAFAAPSAFA